MAISGTRNPSLSYMITFYLFLFSIAEKKKFISSLPSPLFLSVNIITIVKHITELIFPSPPSLFQLASSCLPLIGCNWLGFTFLGNCHCPVPSSPHYSCLRLRREPASTSACRTVIITSLCCSGLAHHQQPCWTSSSRVLLLLLLGLKVEDSCCWPGVEGWERLFPLLPCVPFRLLFQAPSAGELSLFHSFGSWSQHHICECLFLHVV